MKYLFFLFLATSAIFGQNNNKYKLCKEIEVNQITLYKSPGHISRPDKSHILTEVYLSFRNDSCFVFTKFTDDVEYELSDEDYLNPKFYNNYNFVISKSAFFDIVKQMQNINFEAIEKDIYNVFDGITHTIKFGNYNYNIEFSYYALGFQRGNKNAELVLKLFDEIWVLVKNNSKPKKL